jgi:hypothetical protein
MAKKKKTKAELEAERNRLKDEYAKLVENWDIAYRTKAKAPDGLTATERISKMAAIGKQLKRLKVKLWQARNE